MKNCVAKIAFYWIISSSLMLLPTASFAIDLFDTNTGYLVIPEVDVNGDTFYNDVTLKLDFATGKFEVVSATPKPDSISNIPLDSMEEQNIKMDFMGCTRSGRNEIVCHLKLTSLGGFDRSISIGATSTHTSVYTNHSMLYDDLGVAYKATEVAVTNSSSTSMLSLNLIAGIPTLIKFQFNDISPDASSVSLFQPEFKINNDKFNGDFRNINF